MNANANANTYICCRCIKEEGLYMSMVYCRLCNKSSVCKSCFDFMERKYEIKEIVCPICCNIYYGELRNSIIKYALYYSIGIDKLSLSLFKRWKHNFEI